jgi:hypothetical protein
MKLALALLLFCNVAHAECRNVANNFFCEPDFRNSSNSPKIIDQNGNYRGNLNNNQYDPNSISNPYGRYGSPYSPDSINNPYAVPNINRGY